MTESFPLSSSATASVSIDSNPLEGLIGKKVHSNKNIQNALTAADQKHLTLGFIVTILRHENVTKQQKVHPTTPPSHPLAPFCVRQASDKALWPLVNINRRIGLQWCHSQDFRLYCYSSRLSTH
jgi:hypothetical protein